MSEHTHTLTTWVGALIDELVRGGVDQVVVCPGSRSTPLALAVARHPGARVWVQLDERSAGFFALGLAKASGAPAALICTSGTAAANFLPAVVEAHLGRVPLIVLTADRPHELRDNGAPQTIEQVGIFGGNTRWFSDLSEPSAEPAALRHLRSLAGRAIAASLGAPAGPVHLNCPFREPLVPDRALLAEIFADSAGQPTTRATQGRLMLGAEQVVALAGRLKGLRHGLILCGPDCPPGLAEPLVALAAQLGYPILADPLSGVRCGPHERTLVLSAYDAFLRDDGFAARYRPEVVLRFGAMPTAKPVLLYLQRHLGQEAGGRRQEAGGRRQEAGDQEAGGRSQETRAYQLVVDGGGGWREPTGLADELIFADEIMLGEALLAQLRAGGQPPLPPTRWSQAWLTAEQLAREVIAHHFAGRGALSEPQLFAELAALLPEGATLVASNSMPIRDLDTFFPTGARAVRMAGNRGANGIDGVVSTALGMAAGGATPLLLAIGDLALYHDSNGLLAAKLHGLAATIVLINNDGGGIFSFLPQASEQDQFEALFGTPHGLDFRPLAALYGACYTRATNWAEFRAAVSTGLSGPGLHIIEVRTTRNQNVVDHRAIWPRISAALREAGLL